MGFGGEGGEQYNEQAEQNRIDRSLNQATPSTLSSDTRNMPDWYLDLYEDLDKFRHYLKAEIFNPEKKEYEQIGTPIMNDQGMGMFIGYLQMTALSKNLLMSNIPSTSIGYNLARDVCHSINIYLLTHCDEFGLKNKDIPLLNTIVRASMKASILRALFGSERDRVGQTFRRSEQLGGMQKKSGWLDNVIGGGGGY